MTTLITRTELEEAISTNSVVLVDALPASYYDQAHLPGAINLVEGDVEALAPKLLPNKDAAIVTYCSNIACNNSQAVANRLEYSATRTSASTARASRTGTKPATRSSRPPPPDHSTVSLPRPIGHR